MHRGREMEWLYLAYVKWCCAWVSQVVAYVGGAASMSSQYYVRYEELRSMCLAAMAHMACNEQNVEKLVAAGAWETVIKAMQCFPNDVDVQTYGCRIIAMLVDGLKLGEARDTLACQVVIRAFNRLLSKVTSQYAAQGPHMDATIKGIWLCCAAIASLATYASENSAQLSVLGACR
jgi:hypothetical protein